MIYVLFALSLQAIALCSHIEDGFHVGILVAAVSIFEIRRIQLFGRLRKINEVVLRTFVGAIETLEVVYIA